MNPKFKAKYEKMLTYAQSPGSGCSEIYIANLHAILAGEAPMFGHHQVSDELVSAYGTRDAERKRLEENEDRLDSCTKHTFSERANNPLSFSPYAIPKWACTHCQGIASAEQKRWYEAGLAHGESEKKNEIAPDDTVDFRVKTSNPETPDPYFTGYKPDWFMRRP